MRIQSVSDLEFIDVAVLERIGADTTVENFGSKISSTFFEAANLLGTLKLKGYINIHSAIGNSPVVITEKGRMIMKDLNADAEKEVGKVDLAVLGNVKGGLKDPAQIESALNINSRDMAYSIYKLWKKGLIEYKVRNAKVELLLTSQGFEHEESGEEEKIEESERGGGASAEIKNRAAEELAKEEFVVGDVLPEITIGQRAAANISYYIDKYKIYAAAIAVLIVIVIAALLVL